jgi:hypothetical protein
LSLNEAVRTLLLLDIDAIANWNKDNIEIAFKSAELGRKASALLKGPEPAYIVPRAHALNAVKSVMDIKARLDQKMVKANK